MPTDPRFPGGQSVTQWAVALLNSIFGPGVLTPAQQAADVGALVTWANTESGGYNPNVAGGRNNPLNTTEGALGFVGQGGTQGNIKDFGSFQSGVDAQAYNLEHTQGVGYDKILSALRAGNPSAMFSAVDASGFGTKGLGTGGVPAGPTGTSSGSGAALTGIDLNPLNWWGDITGGASSAVAKVGVTIAVLAAGLALIVLGTWRSVSPNARQSVTGAAKLAAVA
jgi:hypothetical protein